MFCLERVVRTRWNKPLGPGQVKNDTIGYIQEGVGAYVINGMEEQKVTRGNFIWLPLTSERLMVPVTTTVTIYSIQFNRSNAAGTLFHGPMKVLPGKPAISLAINPAYVENLLKNIERLWIQKPEFTELELSGLQLQLIAQLARSLLHDELSPYVRLQVDRIIEYIGTHFQDPDLTLGDLAAFAGWSERYLISVFKSVTKETPMAYVIRLRLNLSYDLLAGGNLSVSEVSKMVGWRDPAYFSRVFSRHFGRPPSQFIGVEQRSDMS